MSENGIRAKLVVSDAAAAIEFYRTTLGAQVIASYSFGDSIVFAELQILGGRVTLKDADQTDPAPAPGESGAILDVVVADPDKVAADLVAGGGEVTFPVADQPYGARGGRVRDPYGVQWLLQTPVSMTPAEWTVIAAKMTDDG